MNIECIYHSEEEANIALNMWKPRLRLSDWEIHVHIVRKSQLRNQDREGEILYSIQNGYADIYLSNPVDYPVNGWPNDMERVLVHELLHLHFAYFRPDDDDSLEFEMWEREIELLAKIIVDIYRNTNKQKCEQKL